MLNIGGGEIIGLMVLGMILIGPDRMPNVAADAARFLSSMKLRLEEANFESELGL